MCSPPKVTLHTCPNAHCRLFLVFSFQPLEADATLQRFPNSSQPRVVFEQHPQWQGALPQDVLAHYDAAYEVLMHVPYEHTGQ
jgi:hypothetical protein